MTYNVFSGTLNPTHSLTHSVCVSVCVSVCPRPHVHTTARTRM